MYPKKSVTEQIKMFRENQVSNVGFFWYRDAAQYAQFLLIYEDRDTLHDTHALWHKQAMRGMKQYERRGFVTHKVYTTPEGLTEWCRANGLPLDKTSRSAFANEKLTEAMKSPKSLKHSIGAASRQ